VTLAVHRVVTGRWKQNGYVVADEAGDALLIDPGADAAAYGAVIAEHGLRPVAIVNTHGHFDHIGAVAELAERYEGEELPVPGDWGSYRLKPESYEFWQHRDDRLHDRLRYLPDGDGWRIERLGP